MSEKITRFRDIPQFTRSGSWVQELHLDLDPDFQRGHVWDESRQIAYLEFFLRGGNTSRVLYFNHPGWHSNYRGDFVIVDGKQRIEAFRKFINNEIRVFGSFHYEYTDNLRVHQSIKINVNNLQTRREVLQWYLEMNTGGVVHTSDEIEKVKRLLAKEK